jgi:hypothetical protein
MRPAVLDAIRREVRRAPRPFTAGEVYPVPSSVLDEDSVRRYFHQDLGQLSELELTGELHRLELAHRLTPPWHFDRDWYAERQRRVAAELRVRRGRRMA